MSGQNIEIVKLQIRRGPEAQLPILDSGEPAITTDTNKFFIGDGANNHQLANLEDLASVNAQLADIAYNVKSAGAKCDGATDDWNAFVTACAYCVANGVPLYIPKSMKIVKKQDIVIPSLYGNIGSKLSVSGNYRFLLSDNVQIRNIQIEETSNYDVFKANSLVNNLSFDNVSITSIVSNMDGSVQGGTAISLNSGANNLKINKCVVNNFKTTLYVGSQSSGINIDDLVVTNFKTAIYLHGYAPGLGGGTFVDDVKINNVKLINTDAQRTTLRSGASYAGFDGMLFEYVSNARISNLYCVNPAERVIYCSYTTKITMDNIRLKNAGSVKFVGNVRLNTGAVYGTPVVNNIGDGLWVNNLVHETNEDNAPCFEFYDSRNITINNATFDGQNHGDRFIVTKRQIENLNVENCRAKNLTRAFFAYLDYAGGYPAVNDGINQADALTNSDYNAWVKGLKFKNITIFNIGQIGYAAFSVEDSATVSNGTYKFVDWELSNIDASYPINGTNYPTTGLYDRASTGNIPFKGLIYINNVQNLQIKDCNIRNFNMWDTAANTPTSHLPFYIGSNSVAILIKHKQTFTGTDGNTYLFGTLFASVGSEITLYSGARSMGKSEKYIVTVNSPNGVGIAQDATFDLNTNFILDIETTIKYSSNTFAILFGNSVASNSFPMPATLYGYINVYDPNGNVGNFVLKKDKTTVLKASSDTTYSASYDATKISVYRHATDPVILLRGVSSPSVVPTDVSVRGRLQSAQ